MVALGVGEVIDSTAESLQVGDWVNGPMMAQTHAQMPAAMFQKIDTDLAPPSAYLGALGLTTGLTAYVGLLDIGKARGNVFLDRLELGLARHGLVVERYAKPTNTKVAPVEVAQTIAERCDLVVEALSD